jgi:nucleoside-triphosphatase THEP1
MIIIIEGRPGSGKTTCCKHLMEILKKDKNLHFCGFYTSEMRNASGERIGFEIITTSGERAILADVREFSPYQIGKYFVRVENIEKIVVPILSKFIDEDFNILIIDEVGKMEMLSSKFKELLGTIINKNPGTIICTMPPVDFDVMLSLIRRKANKIFKLETQRKNALQIAEQIYRVIKEDLPSTGEY